MSNERHPPEAQTHSDYVVCPWCKVQFGDCWEWVNGHQRSMICDDCGGSFTYWAEHYVTYYATPNAPPPPALAEVLHEQ